MRAAALVLVVLASGLGCGAPRAAGSTTVVDDDPQPVAENQQGGPVAEASLPVTASPLPDTYLWCADSSGRACARAAAALGAIAVKNPERAPASLFSLEDLPDDCTATGMMEIRSRLDRALSLTGGGWRDQGGNRLDASSFSNIYAAAGCISDGGAPVVKIAASSATPRLYLVRVWETGSSY